MYIHIYIYVSCYISAKNILNYTNKPGAALSLSVCWISGFIEMQTLAHGASLSSE